MASRAAILVEELPVWEFRSGFFFITWGDDQWAYPPNQFFRMFASMAAVAKEYKFAGAEVIQFPGQEAIR